MRSSAYDIPTTGTIHLPSEAVEQAAHQVGRLAFVPEWIEELKARYGLRLLGEA